MTSVVKYHSKPVRDVTQLGRLRGMEDTVHTICVVREAEVDTVDKMG